MKQLYIFLAISLIAIAGNAQSVEMVVDYQETTASTSPYNLMGTSKYLSYFGNLNYYAYTSIWGTFTESYDSECFVSQGTAETTFAYDINTGENELTDALENTYIEYGSSWPASPVVFNDQVYFVASDGTTDGIYTIDNETLEPQRIADFKWQYTPVEYDGKLLFWIMDASWNTILATWDGVSETFETLPNQVSSEDGSMLYVPGYNTYSKNFIVLDNKIIFEGKLNSNIEAGIELLILDPKGTEGPQLLKDMTSGSDSQIKKMTECAGKVYFVYTDANWINYLAETDGTEDGTMVIEAIDEVLAEADYSSSNLAYYGILAHDKKIYFQGNDGVTGDQLYEYNTQNAVFTRLSTLKDDSGETMSFNPNSFCVFNNQIYLSGYTADGQIKLHRINGTSLEVVDENVINVYNLTVYNSKLYMTAEKADGTTGSELFVYDPLINAIEASDIIGNKMTVSPNPSNGFVNVNGISTENAMYEICDLSGRCVEKGSVVNGQVDYMVNAGIYVLKIIEGTKSSTVKIVVQ